MVIIFSKTTSLLANEYVAQFPKQKLFAALFKVSEDTGVILTKEKNSIVISGDWVDVASAHAALEHYLENKNQFGDFEEPKLREFEAQNKNIENACQKPVKRVRKPRTTILPNRNKSNGLPEPLIMQPNEFEPQLTLQVDNIFQNYVKATKATDECHRLNNELEAKNGKFLNDSPDTTAVLETIENGLKSTIDKSLEVVIKKEINEHEFEGDTDVEDHFDVNPLKTASNPVSDSDVNDDISKKNLHSPVSNMSKQITKPKATQKRNKDKSKTYIKGNDKVEMKSYECTECNYRSLNKKYFMRHKQRMHNFTLKCDECGRVFGLKTDLRRHISCVHREPSFFCEVCQLHFKFRKSYVSHMKTHDSNYVKPEYPCEKCEKTYDTICGLTKHVNAHHLGIKKESYVCPTCGKLFTQRHSYIEHANVHAGIKPYVCNECGKAFSYNSSLREHKNLHDSEQKKHECEICKKTFAQRTGLHMHLKTHKNTRDYICQICGKGFTQKQALHRHERIHNGDKPFQCTLCQRMFSDSSILRRHMILLHKRDPKDPGSWKKEIINTGKKASDFYFEGGSCHNADRRDGQVGKMSDTLASSSVIKDSPDTLYLNTVSK
ncbi:zinc finger protein 181-like [Dreissena polymorpha]|uniref:C2H2-type domain-containing protein n=1 Tax=Dreissena polymorpha TaxID=45954 RepID=A0A9D4GKU9_DREPO|nr:zinc finger protein 181-like [Dreissena polymorpha]KAH3818723.1 hypothetical protein DPMN_120448 [Dreissena polymorpha]